MNWTRLVESVDNTLGGAMADSASATVKTVLEEIGPWIPDFDLNQMRGLPEEAVDALRSAQHEADDLDPVAVADAVRDRIAISENQAVELVPSVCRVLDEALDDEGRRHFRRNLPDDLVESFARARPYVKSRMSGTGHTLADGEAGSRRPVSQASVAEHDSVAASDDPKGNTKLSGAKGLSQERTGRTLADGKPGSTRSIADKGSD